VPDSPQTRLWARRSERLGLRWRARRLAAVAGVVVGASVLGVAPTAMAADQEVNHFRDVGTDTDPDFCGTGKQVDVAFNVRVTEWFAPHKGDYLSVATGTVTLTNPLTGDMVINRFAGPFWEELVSGDPAGIHVVEFTNKGLPELFKTPHGGVLTRDAGYIVFRDTFDGDTFISGGIVINHGPHPQAESDFELFCQFMPAALGL
jgi:hypothetical protein